MKAWYFIAVLEKCDPSFQDLFYPRELRCQMDKRIIRAIEEQWPVYFPTRKECRGKNWSIPPKGMDLCSTSPHAADVGQAARDVLAEKEGRDHVCRFCQKTRNYA